METRRCGPKPFGGDLLSKAPGGAKRARAALALALVAALAPAAAQARPEDRPTPSGMPVPRWVSLKFSEVNARAGPGDDHRLVWTYRAKGLPVQIVAETREWRKVCDPDGGAAWVHRRTVDGRRTAFRAASTEAPLLARPKPDAPVRALWAPRSIARLDKCEKGWCRLEAGDAKGWVPQTALWGAAEKAVCR